MPTSNNLDEQSVQAEPKQNQSVSEWNGKHFEELCKTLSPRLLEDIQTLFIKVIVDSSLDLDDWIATIFKNIFSLIQLTGKFCPSLVNGHLSPVICVFVTSKLNSHNWSGIWNLWMDSEVDCWLFPWCKVLLTQYAWIQVSQQVSTLSQFLFTALVSIFKATKEISEIGAYLWCALDQEVQEKMWDRYS